MEKHVLLDLVHKHKAVIENKRTEKTVTLLKQKTWAKIQNEFNAATPSTPIREWDRLKQMYEGLKHDARKENSKNKTERYLTGGGPAVNDVSDVTQKVLDIIHDQIQPIPNPTDSSAEYNNEV